MEAVFLKLVNMSITASYLVAAVFVFRLILRHSPKWIHVLLWGLVGLRLVLPFSFESVLSLNPSTEPLPQEFLYAATPHIQTGIPYVNNMLNPVIAQSLAPAELTSANPTQIWSFIFSQLWILGVVIMGLYALISYLIVRRRVRPSIRVTGNLYLCDSIETPFILGIGKPRIYLPSSLDQTTADHVLAHELAHLKRRDHWWKPLGFLLLTVYWFNPVMWLAYILLCRDIEMACDERVIREMDAMEKKAYSQALLQCSVPRHMIAACPLAFGEVGVKTRIKSVLNYKKPAFWVMVIALILCAVFAVCFLTDPVTETGSWEEACRNVLEDIQNRSCYHITSEGQYHGLYFLNDTSSTQFFRDGDTLLAITQIPADNSTHGYLKYQGKYLQSLTYDQSILWDEPMIELTDAELTPWLCSFRWDDQKVDAIALQNSGEQYFIRLKVYEPYDTGDLIADSYHVDFYFDISGTFLYAEQTMIIRDYLGNESTIKKVMTVQNMSDEDIRRSINELTN